MSRIEGADLNWLAFQYVNDELPAEEAEHFEQRLTVDQSAREAVAEAVLLCQAVAAGQQIAAPAAVNRSWVAQAAWALAGAAACLVAVVVLKPESPDPTRPIQLTQVPQGSPESAELALVWVQNQGLGDLSVAETPLDDDLGLAAGARETERELVVPHWMIEALHGSEETKPANSDSQES